MADSRNPCVEEVLINFSVFQSGWHHHHHHHQQQQSWVRSPGCRQWWTASHSTGARPTSPSSSSWSPASSSTAVPSSSSSGGTPTRCSTSSSRSWPSRTWLSTSPAASFGASQPATTTTQKTFFPGKHHFAIVNHYPPIIYQSIFCLYFASFFYNCNYVGLFIPLGSQPT